jgi:hypothetical protein
MATFWERATCFGDGANDLLDLDAFESALSLWGIELITRAEATSWMGLTEPQADELQHFIFQSQEGVISQRPYWARNVCHILKGARSGRAALDSLPNVWTALNYAPE